jgi:hypothetical protein
MSIYKFSALALAVLMAVPAFAEREEEPRSELVFSMVATYWENNDEKDVKIATLNRKLNAAGLNGLPETVVIGKTPEPYWKVIMKRLEKANEIQPFGAGNEIETVLNAGYFFEYPEICYNGKTADVIEIVDAMNGNFMNDTQGVLAFRYKNKKVVRDERFESVASLREALGDDNPDEVSDWLEYDTSSDAVLVMTDLGQQGDGLELYSTKISRCPEATNN